MKKQFLLFLALMLSVAGFAQAPDSLSYQAVIRNTSGNVVANANIGIDVQILQGSASGTVVYEENQTPLSNVNGLVSIIIGNGTTVSGSMKTIDWSAGPYFIKTQTDPAGGTDYSIISTNQILSVPYALRAAVADSAAKAATLNAAYHAGNKITANAGVVNIGGTDGLLVTGTYGAGAAIGAFTDNTSVMYFNPKKAAFRAGMVTGSNWSNDSVGAYSFASGYNSKATKEGAFATGFSYATGRYSTALGVSTASKNYSTAMGYYTTASGDAATAMGFQTNAGYISTAMGYKTTADGDRSTAIGSLVSTNGHTGAMVLGDYSTSTAANATGDNQLMARFAGGYVLYSNSSYTAGVRVAAGGNSWITISDSTKKENFLPVNENDFLAKIGKMKLTTWNYKGQDPKTFRHYGPMAQDFYNAFGQDKYGIIGNDTTINQADMMGVTFIAVQGLIKENEALKVQQEFTNNTLKQLQSNNEKNLAVNEALQREIGQLKADMAALKTIATAALKQQGAVVKNE